MTSSNDVWRKRRFRKLPKTKLQTLSVLAEMASDGDGNVRRVKGNIVLLARENDRKQLLAKPNITLFCDRTFKYSPKHVLQMLTFFVLFEDEF